jgi:regulatory protein spx
MIKIYVSPACLGCRQAIAFFRKNGIKYTEKDFTKLKLTRQELTDILSISENGFDDILSIRSNTYKRHKEDLDEYTINQIIDLIIRYPEILSRPIIIQYKNNIPFRLLIGYNSNDIEIFLRDIHEREQQLKEKSKADGN